MPTTNSPVESRALSWTDLGLDTDEDHPRRLLRVRDDVIAYGGDEGTLVRLPFVTTSNAQNADTGSTRPLAVRRFDEDAIRAVAVSDDGTRVAVGTDSGATLFYRYELDGHVADAPGKGLVSRHGFVTHDSDDNSNTNNNNNNNNNKPTADLFGSQPDALAFVPQQRPGEVVRHGPVFDAPVRQLLFLPDSHFLAIATEAGLAVVSTDTDSGIGGGSLDTNHNENVNHHNVKYLHREAQTAHDESGIRGLALWQAKDCRILSSLAMDGRLCHWDVSAPTPTLWKLLHRETVPTVTKPDLGEMLGADAWDRSTIPVAHSHESILFLPGETYVQARRYRNHTWELLQSPTGATNTTDKVQGHIEAIVAMAPAPNPRDPYLVTSGRDGRVVLWKLQYSHHDNNNNDNNPNDNGDGHIVFQKQILQTDSAPTHLLWTLDQPTQTERLDMVTADGHWTTLVGRDQIAPACPTTAVTQEISLPHRQSADSVREKEKEHDADSDDSVDDFSSNKPSTHQKNPFVDDEAEDDNDDDMLDTASRGKLETTSPTDKRASNLNSGALEEHHKDLDDDSIGDDDDSFHNIPTLTTRHSESIQWPEPQPAFGPSSTSLELTRRFLCWNHIGSVTFLRGQAGINRSTIDIHFTDSAFRRPVSFTDNMGFILGSLGEDGGIFATDLAEDEDIDEEDDDMDGLNVSAATKAAVKRSRKGPSNKPTGSSIYFHRFETFGSLRDKDWYLTLPDGERALGCASGEGWAAVVTSRRFLRLFSSGGNQGEVLWLNGHPVTMAGRGRFVAVVYHESTPLPDGTQKLGYLVLDAMANRVVAKGPVSCISGASTLSWLGFSNDGSLLAMDSDGMLSMLVCASSLDAEGPTEKHWEWMPMLDTVGLRKSRDDSFWPVTVYDGKLVCVPLKGGMKHPDAVRRPVTAALGFRLPLARGPLTKTHTLEELAVRAAIALGQKKAIHEISREGDEDDEDFEKEYRSLSAQVVRYHRFCGCLCE
jgi:chromosome transmission fidelity protein 4